MQQHRRLEGLPGHARLTKELNWARHWECCAGAPPDAVAVARDLDEEVDALFSVPAQKTDKKAKVVRVDEDALYRQTVKHIEQRVKK